MFQHINIEAPTIALGIAIIDVGVLKDKYFI
jgi:hypothetical protein